MTGLCFRSCSKTKNEKAATAKQHMLARRRLQFAMLLPRRYLSHALIHVPLAYKARIKHALFEVRAAIISAHLFSLCLLRWRAFGEGLPLRRHCWRVGPEERLALRHGNANASPDGVSGVIRCIGIKIPTMAILRSARGHRDPQVDMITP